MENDIVVENLVKRYGSIEAVRGISFQVRSGEVFGFLGPNGAGKTTTINILATLLKPTSGKAFVAGYDVVSQPAKVRKSIGIVFQDPSLDDNLTGYENLYIHGRLYGLRGQSLRERIEEALKFVELWEFKDRLVRNYSGGMRRRLEIARAMLHIPRILFLDEPTIGLDPQTRVHIWDYIKRLNKEYGTTIFLTTHYMEEAEMLCDRIAIIDHGKIIALGTAEELKSMVSSDIVYVKLAKNDGEICSKLSITGVENCKVVESNTVALQVKKASEAIPAILLHLEKLEMRVVEVSYRRPSLNDVFIHLTGREIRDSEGSFIEIARMRHRARMR
ncbi:ATP-binding cassette domain-containing protein [Ignisphaera sp. 4213-co]|uniref:ATP-binding cassette domain-containing protein n=1 Tax=Ignisphaera cupida TaxID=3050454 RepID=A0ABD4Z676_9CREN|nr:ATP-binding cassette domain-containing protein [Ignisphaera sp. 4213-co]MDK6028670.1 ATP-binding cassette domain-containing protein [Ignisphaera sp. 4213-co]